jgi:surface polysaccharide O-acyltransferase-like enzyme
MTLIMKKHIVFIDYLRAVACFMVMMVHVTENFYIPDTAAGDNMIRIADEANRFWIAFWNGGIARTCVPLFMIASAFLLVPLKPGTTMLGFYRNRFLRIGPPMLIFLVIYAVLPVFMGYFGWSEAGFFLRRIPLNFPDMAGHLWFMYPLISLYLIIPVVSPWLEKASAKDEGVFLGLFALSTFIPFIHKLTPHSYVWGECWWNNFHMLWYCSGYLGYLVMAHFIRFHLKWDRGRKLALGSLCFVLGSAYTAWSHWSMTSVGEPLSLPFIEYAWEFCTPNVLLASFGAFVLFTCIERPSTPRLVADISRLSFGMYLIHIFILIPVSQFFINGNPAQPLLPVWLAIPAATLTSYILCYAACKLISFIPGSRYIIGA